MKKKIVALLLASSMALSLSACGGSGSDSSSSKSDTKTEETAKSDTSSDNSSADQSEETTYQSILDEYTRKITEATPGVVDEFNTEAPEKNGDVNALAELCNAKVEKLATICNEGVSKMAEIKLKNGDSDDTYNEWAGKLQEVYTTQAQQVLALFSSRFRNER